MYGMNYSKIKDNKLCQINSIDAEMLQPGQIIKVPVYI